MRSSSAASDEALHQVHDLACHSIRRPLRLERSAGFSTYLTWLLPVAIVGYAAVFSVQTTIRRLVSDELIGLRQQLDLSIGQLTTLNRKVTALLEDALERRQQR